MIVAILAGGTRGLRYNHCIATDPRSRAAQRAAALARRRRRRRLTIVYSIIVIALCVAAVVLFMMPSGSERRQSPKPKPRSTENVLELPKQTDSMTGTDGGVTTKPTTTTPSSTASTTVEPTVSSPAEVAAALKAIGVVQRPISYPSSRRREMAAYSKRHYGADTATLTPKAIVLHHTASSTDPFGLFTKDTAAPGPAGSDAELPGVCAHFVILQNGTIEQLVPLNLQCRHAIGLNDHSIGIEMVERTSADNILARPKQIAAAVSLVSTLQKAYGISTDNVIGHGTANQSPLFHDLKGWRNDHVDWTAAQVARFHALLAKQS